MSPTTPLSPLRHAPATLSPVPPRHPPRHPLRSGARSTAGFKGSDSTENPETDAAHVLQVLAARNDELRTQVDALQARAAAVADVGTDTDEGNNTAALGSEVVVLHDDVATLTAARDALRGELDAARIERDNAREELDATRGDLGAAMAECGGAREELDAARTQLGAAREEGPAAQRRCSQTSPVLQRRRSALMSE